MTFVELVIVLVFIYFVVDFFRSDSSEYEQDDYSRRLTTVIVTPDNTEENKPEDELPPYTPPTPKTQAAMADLPPSYDETFDITEASISYNHSSYMVNNDGSNVNINTNNSVNMPSACVINPYTMNNNISSPTMSPAMYGNTNNYAINSMNNRIITVV